MTILVKKTFKIIEDGIDNMLKACNADYEKFMPPSRSEGAKKMNEEFKNGWVIKSGTKYIKIMTRNGGSAWGFVVATDNDKKFKKGDLWKCAGWAAPARNAARGNVLDGDYPINWTGPLYLK